MRLDTLHSSIITLVQSQQTILLDHLKKEAMVIPTPPAAAGAAKPGAPHAPAAGMPAMPPLQVQDLGKSFIEGHEVSGMRYTFTPPPAPQMPQPPKPQAPGAPAVPGAPQAQVLQMPPLPQIPTQTVTEIWTSVKLGTAVLKKVKSAAGEQTTYCKPTSTDEPHPSIFQIPPGYKLTKPPIPQMPGVPQAPPVPQAPSTKT